MKEQVVDLAMYTAGIRNPQGLAINRSGALWLHEHGPRGGDEINIPEKAKLWLAAGHMGVNYSGLKVPEAKGEIVEERRNRFTTGRILQRSAGWLLCQRRFCAVAAQTVYRRAKR